MISEEQISSTIEAGIPPGLDNKRILVLTPDATRTCPLPMLIRAINNTIGRKASRLDFMVALGTHPPMSREDILALYGLKQDQLGDEFRHSDFLNHRWDLPDTLVRLGVLSRAETERLSNGLLSEEVPIEINRKIFEYDLILILGPVFPHEVVGFSGGAKYLFPGISGGEFLHFFHWLAAMITCKKTIGIKDTPVRRTINHAMTLVNIPVLCLALVVDKSAAIHGCFFGEPRTAWSQAADLSAQVHIVRKKKPFKVVLGRSPEMYDEIWVAGKVMYKLEQVVAPGGRLIIYGPHINKVSATWGTDIEKIGYHIRDYFLADMKRFEGIPRGVLAHSTHVRGTGRMENGVEKPDVDVVLATSIPEETCRRINMGYMNPAEINIADYQNREDDGILFVDQAGEVLHTLEGDG